MRSMLWFCRNQTTISRDIGRGTVDNDANRTSSKNFETSATGSTRLPGEWRLDSVSMKELICVCCLLSGWQAASYLLNRDRSINRRHAYTKQRSINRRHAYTQQRQQLTHVRGDALASVVARPASGAIVLVFKCKVHDL